LYAIVPNIPTNVVFFNACILLSFVRVNDHFRTHNQQMPSNVTLCILAK
jgi:hypothetical protein